MHEVQAREHELTARAPYRRALAGLVALLFVTACGPPYQMSVRNVDGPDLALVINGQAMAELLCGTGRLVIRPGVNAPLLPWRLELRRADGEIFASTEVDGSVGPAQELVIRDIGVIEVPPADPAAAAFGAMRCRAP
mgnify:CR=1 FL=1